MPRTSPVHYIAPSAISIVPNANGSENDLAVYVARGVRIKVYSPKAGIDTENASYKDWSLSGRNRRLADSGSPYTIYARLSQLDRSFGYLVFAPKIRVGERWLDKYPYVTISGIATGTAGGDTAGNWYVRLGDVSLPEDGRRTVTLDTGILGTDQFNAEWNLDPDDMPLRVIVSFTIDDEDAGPTPYVPWGGSLLLHVSLAEGWAMDSGAIVTRWSIVRNTGEGPDASWPDDARATHFSDTGDITLSHRRGSDDFGGAVSATFSVTAYGIATPGSGGVKELASAVVTIDAETGESFKLVLSSSVVSYDPDNDAYSPSAGIAVMIRTTDQRGNVSLLDAEQVAGLGLSAAYAVVDTGTWTPLPFSGSGDNPAVAVIPASVFSAHQGLTVRLTGASGEELDTEPVAFVTEGEGTVITGSSIAYAASEDGMTPPADDGADHTVDPDDVTVPDEITSAARTLLSSFASSVQVPTGGVTHAYVSKLLYEADRQYNAGASAYGLPVLYRKANFPNVMDYYGDRTDTSLAFSALTGWLAAMVLTEIRPDRRNDLMRIGYGLGPSKDVFIYRYDFRSDPNVARMAASAIYSAMRGRVRPSLQAMRAEVGRPTFGYSISAVSDGSYEDYKDTYYVDLRSFMPTAPGPYLPAYADRSAIGGVPYDAYDTADHNLQTDLDVYNIVVARYNLDNPSYRQRTVQAIANIELDPVHIFGDNVSTEHYTFHPAFGTDTIGRRIAPDGATATAFDKIGHVGRKNRYWLQDGAYYGRRRPGQGETDGSVKDAPYGVLMDFEIENGDGRGTGYDNEEEYEAAVRSKIYANSYPSGHSAHVFAGALFLMELFPGKADLILRAANQYSTDRQITRYHWLSDCIVGRLAGAAMSAVERGSTDYDSLLLAARTEQGGGTSESAWKPTIAETGIKDGLYLWTRRTTTYSDDRVPTVEYSVARWGVDGDGIAEIDSYYLATPNSALVIDTQSDTYPKPGDAGWAQADPQAKWYATFGEAAAANGGIGAMQGWNVWEKTVIKYDAYNDDGTKKTVPDLVNYRCSRIGKDGQIGMEEYYLLSKYNSFDQAFGGTSYDKVGIRWYRPSAPETEKWRLSDTLPNICTKASEQQSAATPIWSTKMPAYDKATHGDRIFLWNFEQSVDGDGTEYATKPVCIGNHANRIKGVIELYALSASQTPVSAARPIPADINAKNTWGKIPTSGFSDPQVWGDEKYERAPSEDLPYQWNWTRTLYSSVDPETGVDYEDHYHVSSVKGTRGEDGTGTEFIYCRPQSHNANGTPLSVTVPDPNVKKDAGGTTRTADYIKKTDDFVPYQWTDNPVGIDFQHQIEYQAERKSSAVSGTGGFTGGHEWGLFSQPAPWSKWGSNGRDGDGVEYVFIRTSTNVAPTITNSSDTYAGKTYLDDDYLPLSSVGRCTDDPAGTSHDYPFEWVAKRTKGSPNAETGVRQWEKYSGAMALWATFSENVIRLDISNEMDMIPTTAALRIDTARTVETTVRLFDGATEVDISAATVSISGGPASSIATASQSADGKGRKLSWAFIAGKTMAEAYEITVGYTYKSVAYTAVFTVSASKGEAVWQLKPSLSAIPFQRNSDNSLTPASRAVGLSLVKIDGGSTATYTSVQTGLTVRYSTSSMPSSASAGTGWESGNITVANSAENLYIALFNASGVLLDRETVPVVKDGENGAAGTSPWVADLDNEMDSVSCDDKGKPVSEQSVNTVLSLFHGSTSETFGTPSVKRNGTAMTISTASSGVTVSYSSSTRKLTVTYATTAVISGKDLFEISLTATNDASVTRKLTFTVNGVVGDVYNLLPGDREFAAQRDGSGNYLINGSSIVTLKCGYTKNVNGTITTVDSCTDGVVDSKYYIFFRVRRRSDKAWAMWDGSQTVYEGDYTPVYSRLKSGTSTLDINTHDAIEIVMTAGGSTHTGGWATSDIAAFDREKVYVVADGMKGEPGDNGANSVRLALDNEHEDFLYNKDGLIAPSGGATSQSRLYDGQTVKTDSVDQWRISDNDGSSWGTSTSTNATASIGTSGLLTVTGVKSESAVVKVRARYNGQYYFSEFTANRTIGDKFDIIVKPNAVAYNTSETWSDKTISITAEGIDAQGGKLSPAIDTAATPAKGKFYIYYGLVDNSGTVASLSNLRGTSYVLTKANANASAGVYFELRYYNTASDYRLCDYETVEIAKTANGENGKSITKKNETYRYATNSTGTRPAASSSDWQTTKPTLQKGYWLYTETKITWSDNSTTVLYTDERNPNDGVAGQDIIVDGSTEMKYYVGTSSTTHPAETSSDWKDLSQVTQTPGKWLWSKATTWYRKASSAAGSKDAGHSVNYNVGYIAKDGEAADEGRGITGVTEYYKATNSSAEMPVPTSDSGWSTDPNLSDLSTKWGKNAKYLWNFEKVTYSKAPTVERTKPQILAIWTQDGAAGRGIDSITNYYKVTNSATAPKRTHEGGSGWDDNPVAPSSSNPYLWNYEMISWVNGTPATTYTEVQLIGHFGKDGSQGPQGSYEQKQYAISAYASSASGTTWPEDCRADSYWSSTAPLPTKTKPFLWQRTRTYNPATGSYGTWSYARLTGENGDPGSPGRTGLWYRYAGVWGVDVDPNVGVTNTDTVGYYVMYESAFYMNKKESGANKTTPSISSDDWELMNSVFQYFISKAIFADTAYLGSFIVNGDWLISQHGILYGNTGAAHVINHNSSYGGYNETNAYTVFDPAYPNSSKPNTYNFCPNVAIDGKTGAVYLNDLHAKGELNVGDEGTNRLEIAGNRKNGSIVESYIHGYNKSGNRILSLGFTTYSSGNASDAYLNLRNLSGKNQAYVYPSNINIENAVGSITSVLTVGWLNDKIRISAPLSCWPTRDQVSVGEVFLGDDEILRVRRS